MEIEEAQNELNIAYAIENASRVQTIEKAIFKLIKN